jgi:hypothetical protein
VLVNERQVESLEEEIVVKPGTEVTFLRLTSVRPAIEIACGISSSGEKKVPRRQTFVGAAAL